MLATWAYKVRNNLMADLFRLPNIVQQVFFSCLGGDFDADWQFWRPAVNL